MTGKTVKDFDDEITAESRPGIDRYRLVFVNSDSGHRTIAKVEVDPKAGTVWLYEGPKPE